MTTARPFCRLSSIGCQSPVMMVGARSRSPNSLPGFSVAQLTTVLDYERNDRNRKMGLRAHRRAAVHCRAGQLSLMVLSGVRARQRLAASRRIADA